MPDVCASVQLLAPGEEQTKAEEFKLLNKTILHSKKTKEIGMTYRNLNLDTVKIVLMTYVNFANAR